MHCVEVLIPCSKESGQDGCAVGHRVFKDTSWQRCKDFADQHHMLTGLEYVAFHNMDVYSKYHVGTHNAKFLIG